MKVVESNLFFDFLDILLRLFMWVLSGFKFPVQETHMWHVVNISSAFLPKSYGVLIKGNDYRSKFGHDAILGLYHMPIFAD